MREYFHNLWIACSQLVNALFGGDPLETLSSKCHRRASLKSSCPVWFLLRRAINRLHYWQNDHCYSAFTMQESRRKSTERD